MAIYLVTGGAGFLGSHVCEELLDRGERVRTLILPNDPAMKYVGLIRQGGKEWEIKAEGAALLKYAAEERMGTPEELGFAIASAADERNGYLAGVDILCDGGSTTGKKMKK